MLCWRKKVKGYCVCIHCHSYLVDFVVMLCFKNKCTKNISFDSFIIYHFAILKCIKKFGFFIFFLSNYWFFTIFLEWFIVFMACFIVMYHFWIVSKYLRVMEHDHLKKKVSSNNSDFFKNIHLLLSIWKYQGFAVDS